MGEGGEHKHSSSHQNKIHAVLGTDRGSSNILSLIIICVTMGLHSFVQMSGRVKLQKLHILALTPLYLF